MAAAFITADARAQSNGKIDLIAFARRCAIQRTASLHFVAGCTLSKIRHGLLHEDVRPPRQAFQWAAPLDGARYGPPQRHAHRWTAIGAKAFEWKVRDCHKVS
jgi:hypothetical protein